MRIFYDSDADLSVLDGRQIAIIGYGNQGRAQAMNMRDSGLDVIVGNIEDDSFERAVADGFPTMAIAEAAQRADVLFILVPDEFQQAVYGEEIAPHLRSGQTLTFAHGYNICYGFIVPPEDVDVVMVAPRMIGVGVRERFLSGEGAPAFVAVEQDATGQAWETAKAIAKGIGATKAGALEMTFAQETEMDHFMEQALWPIITRALILSYEVLVENGYPPEAVILELYQSGEAGQIFQEMQHVGLFQQMGFHSRTSQYGTLSRGPRMLPDDIKEAMETALAEIKAGGFAREWEAEQEAGQPEFRRLKEAA